MNFLYLFLFTVFFTFSSNQLQINWKGLNVDLSVSSVMTEMLDAVGGSPKKAFLLFKFPSQKSKNRKYISKLFYKEFHEVALHKVFPRTKPLVNLVVDRQALGFQEVYLNPLLRECITRGFCKRTLPVELAALKYVKEVRFSCFEYLKKNMATDKTLLRRFFLSVLEPERSIRSSPEWNELIDGKDGEFFLGALVESSCNYLYFDGLNSKVLTRFFQKIKALKKRYKRITVSNSQIDLTLFTLKRMVNGALLALKNCPNLKLGKNDQEIDKMIDSHIMYFSDLFIFENCLLDSESLEKCKEYCEQKIMQKIGPIMVLQWLGYLVSHDLVCDLAGEKGVNLLCVFCWVPVSWACPDDIFQYRRILTAMRIAHYVVPMLLKDHFVFAYRLFSAFCMFGIFCFNFSNQYSQVRQEVRRLIQNPFGIMTKYAFLDTLFKLLLCI